MLDMSFADRSALVVPSPSNGAEPNPRSLASGSTAQAASLEEARQRSEASQRFASAFGGIVAVMMQAPGYSQYALSDLKWLVIPALVTGQFSLAQARSKESGEIKPIAVVLWASVSDDVDRRLTADSEVAVRLQPGEWRSGPNLWIVEGIGERGIVAGQIRRLREMEWLGHSVKIKVRGQDGTPVIKLLSPATRP